MKCTLCDSPIPDGANRCGTCGRWHVREAVNSGRVMLCDVKTTTIERIAENAIGSIAMGGGYPRGCVTLVGGEPGTGKSTMAIQLAVHVKTCLYIASEEQDTEIKPRVERLGLLDALSRRLAIVRALGGDVWIDAALKGEPCELVVLDSLSKLAGVGNDAGSMEILRQLKQHVSKHRSHALVITHATKDDWFSGRLAQQHDVDTTLVLVAEGAEERLLVSVKNRHGPSGAREPLVLTAAGLVARPPEPKPEHGRRRGRGEG